MRKETTDTDTEVYQEPGNLPPVAEQVLQEQDATLKKGFERTEKNFKEIDKDVEFIKNALQRALNTATNKPNTNEQVYTLLNAIDRLLQTVEAQNKQTKNKDSVESSISEYELRKKRIDAKYASYRQDTNLIGKFFPEYYKKTLDSIKDREVKGLQKIYPNEAAAENKKVKGNEKPAQTTLNKVPEQTAVLKPASNITAVANLPKEGEDTGNETATERALTQTSIPEVLNEPEREPIKIEIVEINDKVLDKLKLMLEKIVGKRAGQEEEYKNGGLLDAALALRNSKVGSILAKSTGTILKGSGKVIGKTGKLLTETAKGGGMLYKAGMALRKTGGQITGKGVAMASGKAVEKVATKATEKAAVAAAEKAAVSTAAKTATTAGAKTVGKSILKKLPIIGAIAGGVFAVQRAAAGDWTGAGLELASGGASLIPGVGTAASIGIDAAILGRDLYKANKKPEVAGTPALREGTEAPAPELKSEPALQKAAEINEPVETKPVTQITPATAGPATTISAPTATEPRQPQAAMPDLSEKLTSLIEVLSRKEETRASANNIANSNASTTVVNNNIQSSGGEDVITSLRLKTYHFLSDRRRLA